MFVALWVSLAASWACTGDVQAKVVGWKPDGSLALVRFERDNEEDEHRAIDLAVFDVASGKETRRMPILAHEDQSDAATRGANWKLAEAEARALGIVVQPDLAPIPGAKGVYALPAGVALTTRVASEPSGEPDDSMDVLIIDVTQGSTRTSSPPLGRWMHDTNPNAIHATKGVWAAPGGAFALVLAGPACEEPAVHPVKLPTAAAAPSAPAR